MSLPFEQDNRDASQSASYLTSATPHAASRSTRFFPPADWSTDPAEQRALERIYESFRGHPDRSTTQPHWKTCKRLVEHEWIERVLFDKYNAKWHDFALRDSSRFFCFTHDRPWRVWRLMDHYGLSAQEVSRRMRVSGPIERLDSFMGILRDARRNQRNRRNDETLRGTGAIATAVSRRTLNKSQSLLEGVAQGFNSVIRSVRDRLVGGPGVDSSKPSTGYSHTEVDQARGARRPCASDQEESSAPPAYRKTTSRRGQRHNGAADVGDPPAYAASAHPWPGNESTYVDSSLTSRENAWERTTCRHDDLELTEDDRWEWPTRPASSTARTPRPRRYQAPDSQWPDDDESPEPEGPSTGESSWGWRNAAVAAAAAAVSFAAGYHYWKAGSSE